MPETIAVAGAAAVGDYIFHVDHLPARGEIVAITSRSAALVPGGCAPNIAAGIAALGLGRTELFYPVGDDFAETGLEEAWTARGIGCGGLARVAGAPSGRAWMYMQADGSTMCFAESGAAALAQPNLPGELPGWVVVAPVLNRYTMGFLEAAVSQGRRTVVTGIGSPSLEPWLSGLTALILNRGEAAALCAGLGCDGCAALSARYPALLLYVTDGGRGSSLWRQGDETKIPVLRAARLLDFTGAGDSFTAGVVSALAAGCGPERAAWYGAAMASFVVERLGGQCEMPAWPDLERRLAEQFPALFESEKKGR